MQKDVLTLDEVAKKINERPEDIGKFKQLTKSNGYYISSFRNGRGFQLEDTKVKLKLAFAGANQPTSFGHFKSKKVTIPNINVVENMEIILENIFPL